MLKFLRKIFHCGYCCETCFEWLSRQIHREGVETRIYVKELFMNLVDDINAKLAEVTAVLQAQDDKLDEIRAYIQGLSGGATPAQLQTILDGINAMKSKAEGVLAEADELDNPTP